MTVGSSILQGKFNLDLLEASSLISKVPIIAAIGKSLVIPFTVYYGKRGALLVIASGLVLFSY